MLDEQRRRLPLSGYAASRERGTHHGADAWGERLPCSGAIPSQKDLFCRLLAQ